MDYELAKQLKDAGFPFSERWTITEAFGATIQTKGGATLQVPTLEALIEGCGDEIVEMYRAHKEPEGQVWVAKCCDKEAHKAIGRTLPIAVARLWLALNPKTI
jgi:hypothetical protein